MKPLKTAQQISHDLEKILKSLQRSLKDFYALTSLDLIGLTPPNPHIEESKRELNAFLNSFSVIVKRVKTRFTPRRNPDGK